MALEMQNEEVLAETSVAELFKAGNEALHNGNLNDAIERYGRALQVLDFKASAPQEGALVENEDSSAETRTERVRLLTSLAVCHKRRGQQTEALAAAKSALDLDSKNAKALHIRGSIHRESGALDSALADLVQALELEPTDLAVKAELAQVSSALASRQGDDDLAGQTSLAEVGKERRRPRRTGLFTQLQSERCQASPASGASAPASAHTATLNKTESATSVINPVAAKLLVSGKRVQVEKPQPNCIPLPKGEKPLEDVRPNGIPMTKGEWNRTAGKGATTGKGVSGKANPPLLLPYHVPLAPGAAFGAPGAAPDNLAARSAQPGCTTMRGGDVKSSSSSAGGQRRYAGAGKGFDVMMAQKHRQARDQEMLRQQEFKERQVFLAEYEKEYGSEHPPILDGSFVDAISSARNRGRLLLAWMRNPQSALEIEKIFGSSIWAGSLVQELVDKRFVLWQGDTERWLTSSQLCKALGLPATPALVVLQPQGTQDCNLMHLFTRLNGLSIERPSVHIPADGAALAGEPCEFPSGHKWKVLGHLDASDPQALSEGEVAQFLCDVIGREEADHRRAEEEKEVLRLAQLFEMEERRLLREEQDREFQESLVVDQEKARQRIASSSTDSEVSDTPRAERAEMTDTKDVAGEASVGTSPLLLRRRAAAARLQADGQFNGPPESCCRIVVRLPGGHRIERAYCADGPVSLVYDWVDCAAELLVAERVAAGDLVAAAEPAKFEVPENFILSTTFPRQPLLEREVTLRDAGLCPNTVLALMEVDSH